MTSCLEPTSNYTPRTFIDEFKASKKVDRPLLVVRQRLHVRYRERSYQIYEGQPNKICECIRVED